MYMNMYVQAYVCAYMCLHAHIYQYMYAYMQVSMCICMYMHRCSCMYVYIHSCIYVQIYVCTYVCMKSNAAVMNHLRGMDTIKRVTWTVRNLALIWVRCGNPCGCILKTPFIQMVASKTPFPFFRLWFYHDILSTITLLSANGLVLFFDCGTWTWGGERQGRKTKKKTKQNDNTKKLV